MLHLALANATDLASWAARFETRNTLPMLLRRLVHATTQDITHIGFPAGDAVQFSGWDGVVVTQSGNAFVPAGYSAWEMGTSQDARRKADDDYQKRSANPLGVDPSCSTFVFVTPRRWPNKEDWVRARKDEGLWNDIRVYDADSLEEWLDLAPSVHVWLSNHIGKLPDEAADLGTWWLDWSECTTPLMTPQIVLSGRREAQDAIEAWLCSETPSIPIRAGSRNEARAVFAATVMELPPEKRIDYLSRAIVVKTLQAWQQLVASATPLLLIPTFDSPEAIVRAERGGHRVVVALGRDDSTSTATIEVPPLATDGVRQELQASGMQEGLARELAALAKRSLTSFRRQIARNREFQLPTWARPEEGPRLVSFLLAGAWNAAMESDREVMVSLSGVSYAENAQLLTRWATTADPPMRSAGDTWYLLSKDDAWQLLSRYVSRDHLAALERVVLQELGEVDPRLDLPPDERWYATTPASISGHLRDGLAETLVILATKNDPIGGTTGREFANSCVWKLLQRANTDWRLWASLPLVLLAEAAPEIFLEAVDEGLRFNAPTVMNLFETGGDPLFSTSPHTHLLWALEIVAWSPEYLGQATQILARLARLDPGGHTSNRPRESLMQIFLFWHAQTTAPFDQRIQVLNILRRREPTVAWQLFKELLPTSHTIGRQNPIPHWRDWAPEVRHTSYSQLEYYNGVCEIVRFMLEDAGNDASRWGDLISRLGDLPVDQRDKVIQALKALDVTRFDEQARVVVWSSLRSLISNNRSYHDAKWALSSEVVDDLETVYWRFEPQDVLHRNSWLFEGRPELLDGREQDWKEHNRIVGELRQQALCSIASTGGLDRLVDLALTVSSSWNLGMSLGLSDLLKASEEDQLLGTYLANENSDLDIFARGFVCGRVRRSEAPCWKDVVARLWERLTPKQQAHFLLQLPEDRQTFDLAETSPETESAFWRLCELHFVEPEVSERAIRKLFQHGKPFTAIDRLDSMTYSPTKPTARFVIEALRMLIAIELAEDEPSHMFSHHLAHLLTMLESAEDVSEDELASLEWALLPAMDRYGHDRPPRTLHRRLNRDPAFFVELVGFAYKPEGAEDRKPDPDAVARAQNSYAILHSWDTVPGSNENGDAVDAGYLMDWVLQARDGLTRSTRLAVGDVTIGHLFAHSPVGGDGVWPHPAVRDVIESVQSPEIEQGFRTGIFNIRGFFSKKLDEGGDQERSLASRYQGFADALRGSSLRTAAALRRVADVYRGDARKEDVVAELREDLGY